MKNAVGPVGPAGPAGVGPAGPAGPAGKVELMTCVKSHGKQHCTVKRVSGTVKFTTSGTASRATLSRHGVVFAVGIASVDHGHMSLRLAPSRKLSAGGYTLTLITGSGRDERIRAGSFVLRSSRRGG